MQTEKNHLEQNFVSSTNCDIDKNKYIYSYFKSLILNFYCLGRVHVPVVMVTVYVLEWLGVGSPVGQTEDNKIGICFFSANYQLTCFCELMLDYRVACWSTTKQTDIIITSPKSKVFPWYKEIEIFANILHSSFITCFNQ